MRRKVVTGLEATRERVQQFSAAAVGLEESGVMEAGAASRLDKDMAGFLSILESFEDSTGEGALGLDWAKVSTEKIGEIITPYDQCLDNTDVNASKLAIVKLNGGLGTTMGCTGPKSVIEVRAGKTFLDLIVDQVCELKRSTGASVPLVLMNSFNTHEETGHVVKRYEGMVDIFSFQQSQHPRFHPDTHLPVVETLTQSALEEKQLWYPPGHGDVFEALVNSGTLEQLEQRGVQYVFISNVDNLGATVDFRVLNKMVESGAEFIMEVTAKTEADVKGGTLIEYEGKVRLLELAQVPKEFIHEFTSLEKFSVFNTNNIWVSVAAIRRLVEDNTLAEMELIENRKKLADGTPVIQLERAMGSAIRFFTGSHGVQVPRSRFLPVKKTDDLLLIQSNLYDLHAGRLLMSPLRKLPTTPLVKLDAAHFGRVKDFNARFRSIPDILELTHFTVSGDVSFGFGISLRGTVIVVAHPGSQIDVPSGSVLQSSVVSGNVKILNI